MKVAVCIAFCMLFACLVSAQGSNSTGSDKISQYRDMPDFKRSLTHQMTEHIVRVHSTRLDKQDQNPFIYSLYDGSDSPNNTGCFEVVMSSLLMNNETKEPEGVRYRVELRRVFEFNDTDGDGKFTEGTDQEISSMFTWSSETANKRSLVCDNATSEDQVTEDRLNIGNFSSGSNSSESNISGGRKEFVNCTLTISNDNITISLTILLPSKIVEGKFDSKTGDLVVSPDQFESGSSSNSSSSSSSGDTVYLLPSSMLMHMKIDFPKRTSNSLIGAVYVLKSLDKPKFEEYSPDNFTMLTNKAIIFDKGGFLSWNNTAFFGDQVIDVLPDSELKEESADDPSKNIDKGLIEGEVANHFTVVFKSDEISQQGASLLWHKNLGVDPEILLQSKSQ